jgi:hypothetical protein
MVILENIVRRVLQEQIDHPMSLVKKVKVSDKLKYHLDNKLTLSENRFKTYSKSYIELINEVRELFIEGFIDLNEKVQLGKIMQGDVKNSKVYVKNDKGKVVKVNFGFGGKSAKGKRMTIKKNNPQRRKSFRARHNCDNPGPRWKPRYWACRTW